MCSFFCAVKEGVPLKSKDGFFVVDYLSLVKKYAGESYDVEHQLRRKWDIIFSEWALINSIYQHYNSHMGSMMWSTRYAVNGTSFSVSGP